MDLGRMFLMKSTSSCILKLIEVDYPNVKILNLQCSKNLMFECQHDATSGKFHTWAHVMGHSQTAGILKILSKITFKICVQSIYEV
jgi:hypothetical protein